MTAVLGITHLFHKGISGYLKFTTPLIILTILTTDKLHLSPLSKSRYQRVSSSNILIHTV
jgi:hypothetical protein